MESEDCILENDHEGYYKAVIEGVRRLHNDKYQCYKIKGHIGEQILWVGISSEIDKYKMKKMLLSEIEKDSKKKENLELFFEKSRYSNMNELMDKVIYENKPFAIIVIDEATDELSNVMAQLTMSTEVIEIQTYISGNKKLHRFSPFKGEVMTDLSSDIEQMN